MSYKQGMTCFQNFIKMQDQIPLKDQLQNPNKEKELIQYFNYNLNAYTWNLLVNKQIYMKFERLFIEKQMSEKNTQERELKDKLKRLNEDIARLRKDREDLEGQDMQEKYDRKQLEKEQNRHGGGYRSGAYSGSGGGYRNSGFGRGPPSTYSSSRGSRYSGYDSRLGKRSGYERPYYESSSKYQKR